MQKNLPVQKDPLVSVNNSGQSLACQPSLGDVKGRKEFGEQSERIRVGVRVGFVFDALIPPPPPPLGD